MEWNVGDKIRGKPLIGEVIKVHSNGQITVRWPSSLEAVICYPAWLTRWSKEPNDGADE